MLNRLLYFGYLIYICVHVGSAEDDECGDYYKRGVGNEIFTISAPGYPGHYDNYAHCIWLIEVPTGYAVRLTVGELRTVPDPEGECLDYLELRDGSSTANLLYYGCDTAGFTITSTHKWMWIRFRADDTGTRPAFTASYSVVLSGHPHTSSPLRTCQRRDHTCRNKECLTRAYRCDGMNDCGCTGHGCDEHGCEGTNWTTSFKFAIGMGVGGGVFLILFLGIGLAELLIRKRQEDEARREDEEQRKRRFRRPKKQSDEKKSTINLQKA